MPSEIRIQTETAFRMKFLLPSRMHGDGEILLKMYLAAWGVLENGYHVFTEDGKVTFSAKEQGYYDTLSYLHDLYQEELIDHDVFTLSEEQYSARGAAGM